MTNQELLISRITQLSEDEISSVLNAVTLMLEAKELTPEPNCPYCGSHAVIRYGHKCKKQRFLCKTFARTFVTTTNTIMSNSHFQASVWKEMITDTLHGNAIDHSAKRLGLYHQAALTCAIKYCWRCRNSRRQQIPVWGKCLSLTKLLCWTVIKDGNWKAQSTGLPANMVQRRKKGASPMNMSAYAPVSSAKGRPLLLPSTGQNPAQKNSSAYLKAISQMGRLPSATG